jgi:hypothetical protein
VQLNHCFAFCLRKVTHSWSESSKRSDWQISERRSVELVSHSDAKRALDYGDVFDERMEVRGNFISIRHAQTHREGGRHGRISFDNRKVGTAREDGRRRRPCDLTWERDYGVLFSARLALRFGDRAHEGEADGYE